MMKKRLDQIEVAVEGNYISLSQEIPYEDDAVIFITPDQADIVTRFIQEAKTELESSYAENPN